MSTRIAFPFLTLPDSAVCLGDWMAGDPGQPLQPVGSMLENWDYARDLELRVCIRVDFEVAADALDIPADELRLRVVLLAGTGTGTMPRRRDRVCEKPVTETSGETVLSARLSGRGLSGRLFMAVFVTLEAEPENGSDLSPGVPGARLWQSDRDVLIEDGGDSRFPVEAVSFSEMFHGTLQARAPWYLHWHPGDYQQDFSASVRLYVNSDREDLLARFVDGDGPTLQAILGDAVTQLVGAALWTDDIADVFEECEAGSVGRQIRHWLDLAFPGTDLEIVRTMHDRMPGKVRAALLSVADMGERV